MRATSAGSPDLGRYELHVAGPRAQTAYEAAGKMPPWPTFHDGMVGQIPEKVLHVDLHNFSKQGESVPEAGPHPSRAECFLSLSSTQWAAATAWDAKHRSLGFNSVAKGSTSFYAGLQHFQRNELSQAISIWERIRLSALTRAVARAAWGYRYLGVVCSHIALALAQLMDQSPQMTRGSEPSDVHQGPHGTKYAAASSKPIQFFEKTVRWHLSELTLEAEKRDYDKPVKVKRGQKPPPKPRIGVSLLPSLTNIRLTREEVSGAPVDECLKLAESGDQALAGDQGDELRAMAATQAKLDAVTLTVRRSKAQNQLVKACQGLHTLTELYKQIGELEPALECAIDECRTAKRAGVAVLQASAYLSLCSVQFAQLKLDKASHSGEKALGMALVCDAQVLQWEIYLMLAKIYHHHASAANKQPQTKEQIEEEFLRRYKKTFSEETRSKSKTAAPKLVKLHEKNSTGPFELNPRQYATAREVFKKVDADKSRQLDVDELKALSQLCQIAEVGGDPLQNLDGDHDGHVRINEWMRFLRQCKQREMANNRRSGMTEPAAIRAVNRWVNGLLEGLQQVLDQPEAKKVLDQVRAEKRQLDHENGMQYRGSFLARNREEGNVGMHGSKERGRIQSNIDQIKDQSRPWQLTARQSNIADRLFRKLDVRGGVQLDTRLLATIFRFDQIAAACDTDDDGTVTIREWRQYMQKVKLEIYQEQSSFALKPRLFTDRMIANRTEENFDRFLCKLDESLRIYQEGTTVTKTQKVEPAFTWNNLAEFIGSVDEIIYEDDAVTLSECECDEAVCVCGDNREESTSSLGEAPLLGTVNDMFSTRGSQATSLESELGGGGPPLIGTANSMFSTRGINPADSPQGNWNTIPSSPLPPTEEFECECQSIECTCAG